MSQLDRPLLIVYAAAALAIALIGARYLKAAATDENVAKASSMGSFAVTARTGGSSSGATQAGALVVHVAGAVRRPGLVRVRDGGRVGDAIRAAGGSRRGANLDGINLAMRLADGQQVVVPARGPGASAGASGAVSLNAATPDQLDSLDGVGPGLADKIIGYRDQHGGFRSVDELGEVPGIGDKRLESLRAQLQP